MHKIEVFLPLPGMTAAMDDHFTHPNVRYIGGLPTGPELYADDLTETELLAIGLEVAQDEVDQATLWDPEDYRVEPSVPFIAEMHNRAGVHIGWEFEFGVSS